MVRIFTEEEKGLVDSVRNGRFPVTDRIPCIDTLMSLFMLETDLETLRVIESTYLKLASMTDQEFADYDFHVESDDPAEYV